MLSGVLCVVSSALCCCSARPFAFLPRRLCCARRTPAIARRVAIYCYQVLATLAMAVLLVVGSFVLNLLAFLDAAVSGETVLSVTHCLLCIRPRVCVCVRLRVFVCVVARACLGECVCAWVGVRVCVGLRVVVCVCACVHVHAAVRVHAVVR